MRPSDSPKDFKYLYPPLEAFTINHSSHYIKHGEKKKIFRKIFHFVNYDDYENQKIQELTTTIRDEKIKLPDNWLESDTLKYCFAGKFKMQNCIKQLKKHMEWMHNDKFQTLHEESLELLQRGVIYAYGRDRLFRPIIVFDLIKINFKKDKVENVLGAFSHLLTLVYENMFIPGHIENWIIIIDIGNMSIMNVPFKILAHVIDCMSNNYVSTVERLYIVNPSSSLFMMWKIIEAMMDPETVQKIKFLKKDKIHEIQDVAAEDQIQVKYGGKLENLTEFWPPRSLINVSKDIPIIDKKKKALKERLITGCQLTNCLPEKKEEKSPNIVQNFILDPPTKNEKKYEPKLSSPLLSDLKIDDSPLEKEEKKQEVNQILLANNQTKSIGSIAETNTSFSIKNEVVEVVNEIPVAKNQVYNKKVEYEVISEKNELEENKEEEEMEKEILSQPKTKISQREEIIFEKEEKNIKCQPCKECCIF